MHRLNACNCMAIMTFTSGRALQKKRAELLGILKVSEEVCLAILDNSQMKDIF